MKYLLIPLMTLGLFSCSKIEALHEAATEKIPKSMEALKENTSEVVRLTKVAEGKHGLENMDNMQVLSPVPTDLLAAGALFAENATAEEMAKWAAVSLVFINKAKYDDNAPFISNEKLNTPEKFEAYRMGRLSALSTAAAFLPDSTVRQLLTMLRNRDQYSEEILAILALRADYIYKIRIKERIFGTRVTAIGEIEEAIRLNKQVESILRLPFAKHVQAKFIGFAPEMNEVLSVSLDLTSGISVWEKIKSALDNDIEIASYSADQSDSAATLADQNARYQAAKAQAEQALKAAQAALQ